MKKIMIGLLSVITITTVLPTIAKAQTGERAHATFISSIRRATSSGTASAVVNSMDKFMQAPVCSEIKMGNVQIAYKYSPASYQGTGGTSVSSYSLSPSAILRNGLKLSNWNYYTSSTSVPF
ncbi:MAG: hypothetical protein ACRC57_03705 [Sarcina sp.]